MADNLEMVNLRLNQQIQILEQYRADIYNANLRMELLQKMLVEKGIMVKDEFDKRWPQYLEHDVGTIGPDGKMSGSLKVSLYGMK